MRENKLSIIDCLYIWIIALIIHLVANYYFHYKSERDMGVYLSGSLGFLISLVSYASIKK